MDSRHSMDTGVFGMRTITPADPAVGTNFSVTVEDTVRLQLTSVIYTLTTNATVANRTGRLVANNGTDDFEIVDDGNDQGANFVREHTYSIGATDQNASASTLTFQTALPNDFILQPADILSSAIANLNAGDQISNIVIRAKEWLII